MTTRRVRAGDAIYRTRMKQPFKEHDLISPPPRCINCPARLGSIVKAFHLVSGKPCQVHPNCPTTCPDDRDEGQAYSRFLYQEAITSRQLDGVENQPAHKHFGINSTLSSPYDSDYCSCSNETKSPMENGAYPVMGLTSRRPRKYPGGTPENLGSSKQSEKSGSSRQSPSTSPKPRSKFSTSTSKNQRDGQSPSSGSRRCEESESSSSLRAGKGVATASTSSAQSKSTGTSPGPAQTASPGRSKGTASPLKLHSTRSRDKLKAKGGKHAKFRPTTQKAPSKTNLEKKTYSGQTEFDRPSGNFDDFGQTFVSTLQKHCDFIFLFHSRCKSSAEQDRAASLAVQNAKSAKRRLWQLLDQPRSPTISGLCLSHDNEGKKPFSKLNLYFRQML